MNKSSSVITIRILNDPGRSRRGLLARSSARGAGVLGALLSVAVAACAPSPEIPEDVAFGRMPVLEAQLEGVLLPGPDGFESRFGVAAALTPTDAFVGAPYAPNGLRRGVVHPFVRDGGSWKRGLPIVPADLQDNDWFGASVAADGDTLLAGAPQANALQGAAYVFVRDGDSWTQQAKLLAAGGEPGDLFARRVLLAGDVAIANVPLDKEYGQSVGSIRLFERSGSTWTEAARLDAPDGAPATSFGASMALGGGRLLVAAARAGENEQGAVHVYVGGGVSWTYEATLTAPLGVKADQFGEWVSTDGETAVVGAPRVDIDGKMDAGAAYVFSRKSGQWKLAAMLVSPAPQPNDQFGGEVRLSGDIVIVGCDGDDSRGADAGAVYAFHEQGGEWVSGPAFIAETVGEGDRFGSTLALAGGELLVGAPMTSAPTPLSGAAYMFRIGAGNGEACDQNADCASGHCADMVCCYTACDGVDEACSAAAKGQGVDGICGLVVTADGGSGGAPASGAGGGAGEPEERSYYSCAVGRDGQSETLALVALLGLGLGITRRRRGVTR